MNLNRAINHIFEGESLLFLGAGFSRGNVNNKGNELPLTNKLSKRLQLLSGIEESDINESLNIQQTSEYYIEKNGRAQLVDLLKEEFTVSESEEWQKLLAKKS